MLLIGIPHVRSKTINPVYVTQLNRQMDQKFETNKSFRTCHGSRSVGHESR